jgi:hypothetical protein
VHPRDATAREYAADLPLYGRLVSPDEPAVNGRVMVLEERVCGLPDEQWIFFAGCPIVFPRAAENCQNRPEYRGCAGRVGGQRLQAGNDRPDLVFQTVRKSIETPCHPRRDDDGGYLNARHDQNGHRNDPEKDFAHDIAPSN